MTIKHQMSELLIDIINVIQKHVEDETVRYVIYDDLIYLFDDPEVIEGALGDDLVFDKVYREHAGDETEIEEEE